MDSIVQDILAPAESINSELVLKKMNNDVDADWDPQGEEETPRGVPTINIPKPEPVTRSKTVKVKKPRQKKEKAPAKKKC